MRLFLTALSVLSLACGGSDSPSDTPVDTDTDGPNEAVDEDALFCLAWDGMLEDRPDGPPVDDCTTLSGLDRYHCAEHHFWIGLSDNLSARWPAIDVLTAVIEADDGVDPLALSRMYGLRGQLLMAIMLEHDRFDVAFDMQDDLAKAVELDPDNPILPTFADSMALTMAFNTGDMETVESLKTDIWTNVDRCPLGNTLSISGMALGMPMATGWPDLIAEALAEWSCTDVAFCTQNTWKAPFARPGLAYHFAETRARVGDTAGARTYLELALSEPGHRRWPYRSFVDASLNGLDAWVSDFNALDADDGAGHLTYAGQAFACVFCHASAPPDHLVPDDRLGAHNPIVPFDDGGPPDETPVHTDACDNDADLNVLSTHEDIGGVVGDCAVSCLGQGPVCTGNCIQEGAGFTDDCTACFTQVAQCTVNRCAIPCIQPDSAACGTCQSNRCFPAFETCAGVAMP